MQPLNNNYKKRATYQGASTFFSVAHITNWPAIILHCLLQGIFKRCFTRLL